ncbi:YozE family protein [Carnobacterium gallinarum]|uniref:YozE family protein n=1 Tax=Carnobacterium gallinarum TaxID=2749 RepID=UPI00054CE536|nr:YozE family protein [Carnobacterium gallinarum]
MRQSFYQFLMTERNPHKREGISQFANDAFLDTGFPKQSENYHDISHYLEMNGDYLSSMRIFDEAWERYIEKMT